MTTLAELKDNGFDFLKSARRFVPALLATVGSVVSSCGDKDTPTPGGEPVDPPKNIVMRLTADSESAITFARVIDPNVAQNDAQGLGYIYDVKFSQNGFKAATSEQPPGQVGSTINEPYTMTLYEDRVIENRSKTKLEVDDVTKPFALIKAGDGSFGSVTKDGRTYNVSAFEVYLVEGGNLPVKSLYHHTVKEALDNSKYNFATGKWPRTINVTNPAVLSVARIGE